MTIRLPYKLIRLATKDFDERSLLGEGASGKVYKGHLEQGVIGDKETTVAIKRLNPDYRQHDFQAEVKMLSALRHCNILSLLGYCDDHVNNGKSRELILVFDFMVGGNLGQRLYGRGISKTSTSKPPPPPLSWVERLKICIGIGQGLNYLHTGLYPYRRIIHGDVKSFNILLDENLVPKVSDFGFSKPTPAGQSYDFLNSYPESLCGSPGYLEPALLVRRTKKVTTKSDVYAFGVVLLETLCGRHARNTKRPLGKRRLTTWAGPALKKYLDSSSTDDDEEVSASIREIMDSNMVEEIKWTSLKVFVKLVNQCLDEVPEKRPTIAQVVAMLQHALAYQVPEEYDNCHPVHPIIVDEYDFIGGLVCYDSFSSSSSSSPPDDNATDDHGSTLASGTHNDEDDANSIAIKA